MLTETKQTTTFAANDIHCNGCSSAIQKALAKVPGITKVAVDIDEKSVRVEHTTTAAAISAALERAGFPATTEG